MQLQNLVIATDFSPASRHAMMTAAWLGGRIGARLWPVHVRPVAGPNVAPGWTARPAGPFDEADGQFPEPALVTGLPGIEIVRYAELVPADLIVLGRSKRSSTSRWLIGDTGDAVARRSSIPCLFVPPGQVSLCRALVAVDGTERGLAVLRCAAELAGMAGLALSAVTVESDLGSGPDRQVPLSPSMRSRRITGALEHLEARRSGQEAATLTAPAVITRQGEVVAEILSELDSQAADLLILGYHRGGPSGILEGHSIARRLVHWAPTAVLTVPL